MTDMIEHKALTGDPAAALADFARTFEAFRQANDERLASLEAKKSPDVLVEERLARIDAALDEAQRRNDALMLKARRPALEAKAATDPSASEHKAAFDAYMRGGDTTGLRALEAKALSAGSGPDGGFLVPVPAEREILQRMTGGSPMRALASVRETSTATYKKAYSTTGPAAGWAAETAARPQTNSPVLADLTFPTMELYAMPSATQTVLDDAAVDLETWLAGEIETVFAEQESAAFVSGDGTTRPQGFLTPNKVANASWSWGNIGFNVTGAAGAFPTSNASDVLVDLIYSLKAGYRQNAAFAMTRRTQSVIRKLKMTTGEYLWQPPTTAGAPATLMNFPLVEMEEMPEIAANSFAIAFADFRRAYLIVDRTGIRVLRDPYSAKPYVLFYVTKRVGGGVQDFEAIKLLRFGTS
jgi:HK97 family phage major capsid protein